VSEIWKTLVGWIALQKGSHAASAATISTGAAEKIISPEAVSGFDLTVSYFGDAAVIIAPLFTLFLFYKAWKHDRLDTKLKMIRIANEGRRDSDKGGQA
jgi:hypothetical protein